MDEQYDHENSYMDAGGSINHYNEGNNHYPYPNYYPPPNYMDLYSYQYPHPYQVPSYPIDQTTNSQVVSIAAEVLSQIFNRMNINPSGKPDNVNSLNKLGTNNRKKIKTEPISRLKISKWE